MEEQFAALTIPNSRTSRSKSIKSDSFCELSSGRFIQSYTGKDPTSLIKQYSYNQIKLSKMMDTDKDEHIRTRSCSTSRHDSLKITQWFNDNTKKELSAAKPINNEIEYMEVDDLDSTLNRLTFAAPVPPTSMPAVNSEQLLPLKSNEDLAKPVLAEEKLAKKHNSDCASGNERNRKPNSYQDMKKKIRSLVTERPAKEKRNYFCTCFKLLFSMLFLIWILLITIIIQRNQNFKHSANFFNAIGELKKQIHGQDDAVQILSEYLQLDEPALKVIALVGGTGVGKSYTVEIIKSYFSRQHSIRQNYPPIEGTVSDISSFFPHPRLIVLENLKEHDLTSVVNYLKTLDKLADQYITIFAVFNVEQMNDYSMRSVDLDRSLKTIRNSFAGENIDAKIIPYVSLSENDMEECIMDAARDSGLTLSDSQVNLVKENLLANNAGCKGAYSKVQVIGRQQNIIELVSKGEGSDNVVAL